MSLDDHGFLSEDIANFQKQIREQYTKYFDVIQRVNTFYQQAKFRLSVYPQDGRKIVAVCLIIKIMNDMQAAILLAERGLVSQSRSLIRTGLEAFIILANICHVEEFWHSFITSDQVARLKLLRAIRDNPSVLFDEIRPYVTPELIDQLNQEIKESGVTEEKVKQLACELSALWADSSHL